MMEIKDKRTAILDAALKLIAENGFHGTAVSQIAEDAGVSVGIIYRYFESKDDLIEKVYRIIILRATQAQLSKIDSALSKSTQIRLLLANLLQYFIHHPQEAAFIGQYLRSPYFRQGIADQSRQDVEPIIEYFQRAQDQKIIKQIPYQVIATLTLDMATSLSQKHASGFIDLTDKLVAQIIEASWDAIRM